MISDLLQYGLVPKRELLEQPLEGHLRREHEFLLRRMLMQTRFPGNQPRALRRAITRHLDSEERQAVALWDTIPGVNEAVSWTLVSEIGVRLEQFPDAHHLASWIAFCPGNHESGGKRRSGTPIVATAHALAIIACQMLKNNEPYRDPGESHFDRLQPGKTADRRVRRLQKLGYDVSIQKSIAHDG